jgi:choloylglycine hydrolase
MCTAINDISKHHLFGRTLDLEYTLDEQVVITPRRFAFRFIHGETSYEHYAIIGAAHVSNGTPLYYDGMNEKGLCAAALRLPALAAYHEKNPEKRNFASFELIPWLLCNFDSAKEAKKALREVNVTPESFSDALSSTPLHWIICDSLESFVVESVEDGLKIYDNPYGVLTNAPDFPTQIEMLEEHGEPRLGDLSSSSRFIRAVNAKTYTLPTEKLVPSISRFFHLMSTVNQPAGLFRADERQLRTVYTSCMDTENKIYYFTTYDCRKIRGVRMKNAHLDLDTVTAFPMKRKEWIHYYN